jgi:hypothetical protein
MSNRTHRPVFFTRTSFRLIVLLSVSYMPVNGPNLARPVPSTAWPADTPWTLGKENAFPSEPHLG